MAKQKSKIKVKKDSPIEWCEDNPKPKSECDCKKCKDDNPSRKK